MQFYFGPSQIDGAPIVGLATGLARPSSNRKTGAMVQTYILRADQAPLDALRAGADASVCGGCTLRGSFGEGRVCYVNIGQDPTSAYAAWQRGRYPKVPLDDLASHTTGRYVRLGAYGDPAAIPIAYWDALLQHARGWTGYTHQWRSPRLRAVLKYCHASCDTEADVAAAQTLGAHTFRVRDAESPPRMDEIVCTYETETTQCRDCLACGGQLSHRSCNVTALAHGPRANQFLTLTRRQLAN